MAENQSHGNPNVITRNRSDIQWDESQTQRHYANRSTVTYNREEIAILFGVEQVRQIDFEEISVELTNRIVMRPLIAKQFSILLNETVRKYEGIWGTIELLPTTPTLSPVEKLRKDLFGSGTERSVEKAQAFIQPMSELNVEIGIERSFKAYKRQLLDKRFLIGINCKDLEDRSEGRLQSLPETTLGWLSFKVYDTGDYCIAASTYETTRLSEADLTDVGDDSDHQADDKGNETLWYEMLLGVSSRN